MTKTAIMPVRETGLDRYVAEINQHPVLDRAQEQVLAKRFYDDGDVTAAHKLVVSNLRFVVKVAHEYKGYGLKLLDLIQEGNIGLMVAVKKFNPHKGYRLISYAVWWIRAYMKNFILRSWSLVRLGTTQAQRKLFFKLRSTRSQMEQDLHGEEEATLKDLAASLGVTEQETADMEGRMAARDFSLDNRLDDSGGSATHLDQVRTYEPTPEDNVSEKETKLVVWDALEEIGNDLDERENFLVENRLLSDEPQTLQEVGDHFGVSRERMRQVEEKLMKKLRRAIERAQPKLLPSSMRQAGYAGMSVSA